MTMLRAADIHARLGSGWHAVLVQLGIPEDRLRKKAGPCPICVGTDRFTFDNRNGHGDYFCRRCGAGDGFTLLERVHGWDFAEARRQVMLVMGISQETEARAVTRSPGVVDTSAAQPVIASPPQRVRLIARGTCPGADCPDAVGYLGSRGLWPLPAACTLRGHPALEYCEGPERIGRFPGLVAEVRDLAGELVTVHVTYLEAGRKLAGHEPRKLLSKLLGREGCAVRLMPATDTLGIAEGIETALSAATLEQVPVWAALNTSLLSRFEPPLGVSRLVIFADRDEPGLIAAGVLMERLQGRIRFELRMPPAPHKDFNDVLMQRRSRQ